MSKVSGILNSRPLTPVSSDLKHLETLTPNQLLLLPSLPVGSFGKEDSYSKRRRRQVRYMSDIFWMRWLKEYLPTLQERAKWMKPRRSLAIGDLVLTADENVNHGKWPVSKSYWCLSRKRRICQIGKGSDEFDSSYKTSYEIMLPWRTERTLKSRKPNIFFFRNYERISFITTNSSNCVETYAVHWAADVATRDCGIFTILYFVFCIAWG